MNIDIFKSYNEHEKRFRNVDNEVLLSWLTGQLKEDESISITDISSIFKGGKVLCAIIHHYRPDLLDYNAIKNDEPAKNNQLAIDTLEKELGIPPIMTGVDITNTDDYLTMASYLTEVYDAFRGEIPHIKLPKMKLPSRIPKPLIPPKPKLSSSLQDAKKEAIPCKKCFEAYNSEIKTYPPKNVGKKTLGNELLCSKSKEKNIDIVLMASNYKGKNQKSPSQIENKRRILTKSDLSRTKEVYKKRKQKSKQAEQTPKRKAKKRENENVRLNHSLQSTSGGNVQSNKTTLYVRHKELEEKCIEKIVNEKNEKLKNFMTKLYLKKKKSKLRKCSLSVIAETKIDIVNNKESEGECKRIEDTGRKVPVVKVDEIDSPKMESGYFESTATEFRTGTESSLCNVATIIDHRHYLDGKSINFASEQFEQNVLSERLLLKKCVSRKKSSYRTKSTRSVPSSESLIRIRLIEKKTRNRFTLQNIEYFSSLNRLTISSKVGIATPSQQKLRVDALSEQRAKSLLYTKHLRTTKLPSKNYCSVPVALTSQGGRDSLEQMSNSRCQSQFRSQTRKFPSKKSNMNEGDCMHNQIYSRVSNWISSNDFSSQDNSKADTDVDTVVSNSKITDITSVSKMDQYEGVRVEERTDVVTFSECEAPLSSEEKFAEKLKSMNNKSVRTLSKFSQYSPFQYSATGNLKSASAPPTQFSVIVEGEESELPESVKMSEVSFKTIKTSSVQPQIAVQLSRPSSRHKRHAEVMAQKPCTVDRKTRKRRTLERVGASVMFAFFLRAFLETGIVAVLLFILDIVVNSEQYGYQNYIFSS